MGKKAFWNVFRRWGSQKPSGNYEHVQHHNSHLSTAPAETEAQYSAEHGYKSDPAREAQQEPSKTMQPTGPELTLSEAISCCAEHYIKPVLRQLFADDKSVVSSPTSKGVLALLALYWLLAVGSSLIGRVAALVAPAWWSVRALEEGSRAQQRCWLRYWAVYGVVGILSVASDPLLCLVPGYWTVKTLVLLWCAAPFRWHGADYVLTQLIIPAVEGLGVDITESAEKTEEGNPVLG